MKLISARVLADYMAHRGESVRSLARRVGCSPSLIGHLRSGERTTCQPQTARRIEEELNAPPGSLFSSSVSRVTRDVTGKRVAS